MAHQVKYRSCVACLFSTFSQSSPYSIEREISSIHLFKGRNPELKKGENKRLYSCSLTWLTLRSQTVIFQAESHVVTAPEKHIAPCHWPQNTIGCTDMTSLIQCWTRNLHTSAYFPTTGGWKYRTADILWSFFVVHVLCRTKFPQVGEEQTDFVLQMRMMNVFTELCSLAVLFLTVGLTLGLGPNQHMDFTFLLPAGSAECFYQTTTMNDSLEVEYQVKRKRKRICLSVSVWHSDTLNSFHQVSWIINTWTEVGRWTCVKRDKKTTTEVEKCHVQYIQQ